MTANFADAMPFSRLMGIEIDHATPELVRGRLEVTPELCTTGDILHGGAAMAFADSLGAIGAFLTLPEGANGTTTIESTSKFLGAATVGATLVAETEPIKVGRRLSVWQTRIRTEDGRDVCLVTQTQLTL
ncbi:MAG: PaaI family thioesterase [Actinobacteria bacterium]|nr:PaaI family thioesterase [Actinomycetota bacterium]